jgi:hypothetical protein
MVALGAASLGLSQTTYGTSGSVVGVDQSVGVVPLSLLLTARGRTPDLPRDGVGDDAGDVLGCAVCVREVDQLRGNLLRCGGYA